jgi:hypothetical protein
MMTFLFHFSAAAVLPFWGAMILFPRSSVTERMVSSPWIIMAPVLCYLAFALPNLPELALMFADPNPGNLAEGMARPWAASMFWAYAGAFDLFVGRWMFFDAQDRRIHPIWVSPALFVAIFLGPLGFTMYGLVVAGHWLKAR